MPNGIATDQVEDITLTDDGGAIVALDGAAGDGPINVAESDEMDNLVPGIKDGGKREGFNDPDQTVTPEEYLDELGQDVVQGYKTDLGSLSEWARYKAIELKLFLSYMPPKTYPWPEASNVNLPFITIAVIQFQARAFDAIISNRDVVKTYFTGKEDEDKSNRVAHYMNYQLLYKMDSFEEGFDKTLVQLPIMGSVFRKTYWDPIEEQVRSDWISASDLVVNYGTRRLEDASRITHIIPMTQNDIRKRVRDGIYMKEDAWDLGDASDIEAGLDEIRQANNEAMGEDVSYEEKDRPRYILEQHRDVDIDGDGIAEPMVVTVDLETEKVLRITSREYTNSDGKVKIIHYFTHYEFIPNPEGFYGLGYGTLLRGLNEAANTIANEIIDAGSLANLQGGFISKRIGSKKGEPLTFKQGEFKEIDALIDDLRKSIYTFDFKGPNATLFSTLGLLYEYAKMVSSVSETMTGALPASDTPASTVMALIEEGRKVYSAIHKRTHRSFKKELKKIQRLNSIFLDEKEYFQVLGEDRAPQGPMLSVIGQDFSSSIDVIPVSDPTITSRAEKIMKTKALLEEVLTNPVTAKNEGIIVAATKRYFTALDEQDISDAIQPPPPPPDLPPEQENAGIIQEKPATVLPPQDHQNHMLVHEELTLGAFADQMSPAAKKLLERHQQEHLAALYLQEKEAQSAGGGIPGVA